MSHDASIVSNSIPDSDDLNNWLHSRLSQSLLTTLAHRMILLAILNVSSNEGRVMKCLCLAVMVLASAALCVTIELEPLQDAYVCDCLPGSTNPNGNSNYLYYGQYGSCYDRTLIEWDLSGIPSDATVISASMELYCEAFWGTESGHPVYYPITGEWDEETVSYATQPEYDETAPIQGEWPEEETWLSVNVTPFAADWVSGSLPNHGIYCFREGTVSTCVPGFWSSDYSDETLHPVLVIEYVELGFEPGTWGFLKALFSYSPTS